MASPFRFGAALEGSLQVLWEDDERVFCRGVWLDGEGRRQAVLAAVRADNPADLAQALKQALAENVPMLIDVVTRFGL